MNGKLKIKNVKLIIFFFFLWIITGCSEKSINIYAIVKPNELNSNRIRFIKIDNIKNDKVNLKEKIILKMKEVNKIVPNYFYINPQNYKNILTGNVNLEKK